MSSEANSRGKEDIPVKKYSGPEKAPQLPDRDQHRLFIENAERIRHTCTYGDHEHLSKVLANRANPCYADEMGITGLMLAAWNGHLECVKFLIANPLGISKERVKCSCVNLQTLKGLTALHIFCQEALPWADEILFWLLLGDADTTIPDKDGKSPLDYARENGRDLFVMQMEQWVAVFKEGRMDEASGDALLKRKVAQAEDELSRLYAYKFDPLNLVGEIQANFPVPKFLTEEQRVGSLPQGMKIHEHHIKPLANEGTNMTNLVDSLHCMDFSKTQATVNVARREQLMKKQMGADWETPKRPPMVQERTRNRRKKGDVHIQETKEERLIREAAEKEAKEKAAEERRERQEKERLEAREKEVAEKKAAYEREKRAKQRR